MAMMAGLQRSAQTFRRSGSSGLVWDERFLQLAEDGAGPGRHQQQPELRHSRSVGSAAMLRRAAGAGGEADGDDKKRKKLLVLAKPKHKHRHQKQQQEELLLVVSGRKPPFRTRDVAAAGEPPPSPRVPAGCCAPCAIFRDAGAGGSSTSSLPRRGAKKR